MPSVCGLMDADRFHCDCFWNVGGKFAHFGWPLLGGVVMLPPLTCWTPSRRGDRIWLEVWDAIEWA